MIDYFSLGLSHALMLLAAWHLLFRPDLDDDAAQPGDSGLDIMGRAKTPSETEGDPGA